MIEIGTAERTARDVAVGATRELPHEVGVLPLRDTVTFPEMMIPLNIGQPRSVELINDVLRGERTIAMVASRNAEVEA
ncbi:MAG TPA: LON peptidase substrate-binding domain-containing protein, partial [Solirubrobacteraceae bacterium]|nr:LON peptidase substrate-binding domain-containing protein [Solirubrobacteraceae bacterium]